MIQKFTLFLVWTFLLYSPFSSVAQCTEPEVPTIQVSDTSICLGGGSFLAIDSGALNDAGGWVWRKDSCNGAIVDTGTAIFVFPTQTTTYFVKGEGGCVQQNICAMVTIVVLSGPTPTIFGNDTICQGQTAELYINSGPYTILWSDNTSDTVFSDNPTQTTAYSVLLTDTNTFCSNVLDFEVYVHTLSSVSIFGDPFVCIGSSDTLYASGFEFYQWSNGSTDSMIVVSPTITTTYSVLATDSNLCSSFATFELGVIPNPSISINGDPLVCSGEGSNLNASPANQYLWSTGEISSSITVFPSSQSTYSVTGTDANGCFSVASFSINVLALPNGFASADTAICLNDTVRLLAQGGDAYQWNTNQDTHFIDVAPITSTYYWVIITDTITECSVRDSVLVTIHPSTPVTILGDSIHCQNTLVVLTAQGGGNYLWSTGQSTDTISVLASYQDPIYVQSTDSNACVTSDTITLDFLPAPSITFTGDVSVCLGDTTHITASGAQYYIWYTTDFGPTLNQLILQDQYVSVEAFNPGNGCSTIDSVLIRILPLPLLEISGDTSICLGQSTVLTASGAVSYSWSTGSMFDTTQISLSTSAVVFVQATDTNGCMQTDSTNILIYPVPSPMINLLQDTLCVQGPNLTLSAFPNGGDFSGTGIFGSTFIPAVAGPGFHTVLYEYTNNNGCYGQDTAVILVQSCVGVEENTIQDQVRIYPNPGTNYFWLDVLDGSEVEITIVNNLGAQVMQKTMFKGQQQIDISALQAGVYYIHIRKDQDVLYVPYLIAK